MRTLGTKLPPNKILSLYQPIFLVSFQWQMTENILTFYVNKSISVIDFTTGEIEIIPLPGDIIQ